MVTEKERMLLEIVLAVIFIAFLVVLSIVVHSTHTIIMLIP